MPTVFDQVTEGNRERELMRRVREGLIRPEEIEAASLPFFLKIQIQTLSPCNAACVMCPWPETKDSQPQGFMDEDVFRTIIDQCAGRGVERTSLFLMNEPTLDRRLESFCRYVKEKDSKTSTVIFTNGVLLDGRRAESLAAAGMDEIDISVLAFDAASYAKTMGGLDYARILANLRELREAKERGRLGGMVLKIIALEMPHGREGLREFEAATGFNVYFKPVTNRAGLIDVAALGAVRPAAPQPRACQRPFVKGYFLYNGDMVLCNCDWKRTTIIGNVKERPIEDLWRSARLMEIRRHHLRGTYPADSLCAKCDYPVLL